MTIADTDVLIDALRGRADAVAAIERGLRAGTLATTAVTLFELRSGAADAAAREAVDALIGGMDVVPFDAAGAARAAEVRRDLESRGQAIGMADYMIAGACLSRSADLLTRNRRHFERVPSLRLA